MCVCTCVCACACACVCVCACVGSPVLSLCFLCFSVNLMEVDRLALEMAKEVDVKVEVEAVMEEDPGEEVEAVVGEEVGAALVEEVALEEEVVAAVKKEVDLQEEVEGHPSPSPIPQNLAAVTHKVKDNSKAVGWGRRRCQLPRYHPCKISLSLSGGYIF